MWKRRMNAQNVAKGALAGLIGGVVGALTMELFQAGLKKASGQRKAGGEPATVTVAQNVSEATRDKGLAEKEKSPAGEMVHYAFGASAGAVYGVAVEALPKASAGWGALFGAALWLLADEIGVAAAGLGKYPDEAPVSEQASALAAHLVYGLTTDAVRRGVLVVLG
jgi:putative membrane protein